MNAYSVCCVDLTGVDVQRTLPTRMAETSYHRVGPGEGLEWGGGPVRQSFLFITSGELIIAQPDLRAEAGQTVEWRGSYVAFNATAGANGVSFVQLLVSGGVVSDQDPSFAIFTPTNRPRPSGWSAKLTSRGSLVEGWVEVNKVAVSGQSWWSTRFGHSRLYLVVSGDGIHHCIHDDSATSTDVAAGSVVYVPSGCEHAFIGCLEMIEITERSYE
jgi:mannose-6-phosphate isomerase-like protein (cupin superfamily)